jgi:hypothetical protein
VACSNGSFICTAHGKGGSALEVATGRFHFE